MQIGEQFQLHKFNGNHSIYNKGITAGANITWDFSDLVSSYSSFLYIQPNPGVIRVNLSFPTATASIAAFQIFDFIQANNDSVNYVGHFDNTAEVVNQFSDSRRLLQYPFTYGSAFTDSYAFVQSGNFPSVAINGTYTVSGEGYGTLILPIGIFNNVLKVKSVDVGVLSNSNIAPGTKTTFEWYLPGVHFPILKLSKYIENNSFGEGYYLNPATLGTKQEFASQLNLQTFPNPATSEVTIQATFKKPSELSLVLTDAPGKVVLQKQEKMLASGSYSRVIDVSKLPKGVYFIRLETDDNVTVKKTYCAVSNFRKRYAFQLKK